MRCAWPINCTDAFDSAGVPAVVPRFGPLVGVFFGSRTPVDYASAGESVTLGTYPGSSMECSNGPWRWHPGPWEVFFPSLAHSSEDLEATIEAAFEVARGLVDD